MAFIRTQDGDASKKIDELESFAKNKLSKLISEKIANPEVEDTTEQRAKISDIFKKN